MNNYILNNNIKVLIGRSVLFNVLAFFFIVFALNVLFVTDTNAFESSSSDVRSEQAGITKADNEFNQIIIVGNDSVGVVTYRLSKNGIHWEGIKTAMLGGFDEHSDAPTEVGTSSGATDSGIIDLESEYQFIQILGDEDLEIHFLNTNKITNTASFQAASFQNYDYGGVSVVSRFEWGCNTHPEGGDPISPYYCDDPFWATSYNPLTHITIHHTATRNDATNWAGEVFAIWYYHSHVRDADPNDGVQGWTDIGYQYLIDPNGVIYEGRNGTQVAAVGESVTGGHVLTHNTGNIGISMIGTYTDQDITPAARISLERLMQVIIDENGWNPYDVVPDSSGTYMRRFSGHRNWSATACPGNTFYPSLDDLALLPAEISEYRPVYQFLNKANKLHFYTADRGEFNLVRKNLSSTWEYEGAAYISENQGVVGTTPVYRFLHKGLKIHFYTASETEKDWVISTLSSTWDYEGETMWVFPVDDIERKPVYRFLNKQTKTHFYTASENEKDSIIANLSVVWEYEGIAFYVRN